MTDYKNALDSFADRLKSNNQETPIQEVRPIEKAVQKPKKIVRTTIHLNAKLHQKIKLHCVRTNISFKDFVTELIEREIKTY